MEKYYIDRFPWKETCALLERGDSQLMDRRELMFWFPDKNDSTRSFPRRYVHGPYPGFFRAFCIRNPSVLRVDIGYRYDAPPNRACPGGPLLATPVAQYLSFDIDITDYSKKERRNCPCNGEKSLCRTCWPVLAGAMEACEYALREELGYKHILWVYSGRRGVHCWICDERTLFLTQEQRRAVVQHLSRSDARVWLLHPTRLNMAQRQTAQGLPRLLPRLDAAVSVSPGHTLKAAYSIHEKTGCICVMIEPPFIDFDPTAVPRFDCSDSIFAAALDPFTRFCEILPAFLSPSSVS